ncbi:MAG TPA: hypothetical protein VK791_01205 [bacterium]|nr:hypothetical protein [bacterium]
MKTIRMIAVLLAFLAVQSTWAASDTTPSLFSLTYFEFYGTPIQPLSYAQIDTDALGFDVLAEYNPSYYASVGLNFEKTMFYDGFNTTVSFLGLETRFFGAPNGKGPFAPYIYGGAGLGLNAGTGNQLKAGLGSRFQFASPFFLDFSAGSNWLDSGLQYLNFRGGLSVSFDLPKVESTPEVKHTPTSVVTPVNTLVDLLAGATVTATPVNTSTPVVSTPTTGMTMTDTPTVTMTQTVEVTSTTTVTDSMVKVYYRAGMKAYAAHQFLTAAADFKKALAIKDPSAQYYFYAESNSQLGMIYQFYLTKTPNHKQLAIQYYKRALKIDPWTKSAKKYLKMLQAPKPKVKADVADDAVSPEAEKPEMEAAPTAVVSKGSAVAAPTEAVVTNPSVSSTPVSDGTAR